jgi:hypothetical protein
VTGVQVGRPRGRSTASGVNHAKSAPGMLGGGGPPAVGVGESSRRPSTATLSTRISNQRGGDGGNGGGGGR